MKRCIAVAAVGAGVLAGSAWARMDVGSPPSDQLEQELGVANETVKMSQHATAPTAGTGGASQAASSTSKAHQVKQPGSGTSAKQSKASKAKAPRKHKAAKRPKKAKAAPATVSPVGARQGFSPAPRAHKSGRLAPPRTPA